MLYEETVWCFRIRFGLGRAARIEDDAAEWLLSREGEMPPVHLRSRNGESLRDARQLVVKGCGFSAEDDARRGGVRWAEVLQLAFAANTLGADFGDRAPRGALTPTSLAEAAAQLGTVRVMNDEHGLMTYEAAPEAIFVQGSAEGVAGKQPATLQEALARARAAEVPMPDDYAVAFDLWSASFAQPSVDARFLMLMTARP